VEDQALIKHPVGVLARSQTAAMAGRCQIAGMALSKTNLIKPPLGLP